MEKRLFKNYRMIAICFIFIFAMNVAGLDKVMANEKTVYDATPISVNGSYSGKLSGECIDYYQFTLQESGRVTLTISMNASYGELQILDHEYEKLDSYFIEYDSNRGCHYNKKKLYFRAGTYYLKFIGREGTYSFNMDFESADESFAESQTNCNDILSQAQSISMDKKYAGQLGYGDGQDFYKFHVPFFGLVSLSHYSYGEAHMQYYILDIEGKELKEFGVSIDTNKGYAHDVNTFTLKEGDYYLKVYGDWKPQHGFYNFKLKAKPNPSPVPVVQAKRNKSKATIKIEKQASASGYVIQYSTTSRFIKGTTKTKTFKGSSVNLTGLHKTKIYFVRVRAYKNWNGKTYYGDYGDASVM